MVAKVLAGVGLFFALVAVILKSVALSVPHFVDVHFVDDPNNANDGNRLGGVGVFQSEFNSDLQGDIRTDIDLEGIPILNINTPTTEYPLLFPGQENFIADVLPINAALLAGVDAVIPGLSSTVSDELADVEALALGDDCGAFVPQAEGAVLDFFSAFQDGLLPGAVAGISLAIPVQTAQALADGINQANLAIVGILQGTAAAVFDNAGAVAAAQADASCTGVLIAANLPVDATSRACLATLFTIASGGDNTNAQAYLAALIGDAVACEGATVALCAQNNIGKYTLLDVGLDDAPSFADNNAPGICDALFDCTSKRTYLTELAGFVAAASASLQLAILQYLGLAAQFALANTNVTFAENFPDWPQPLNTAFDPLQTGNQDYDGCDSLAPLGISCDTLEDYFVVLPQFLEDNENPLAGTVGDIASLYEGIFNASVPLGLAPTLFMNGLIEGAYNDEFDFFNFSADFTQACEDDVEDLEKIEQAQVLAVASTAFEALAILLMIVGIILPVDKLAYLAPAAAIGGILGGVFILAALFVVQSAPVYDGVGEEGSGEGFPEIFFIQGYVPLLALVDAVLFFLSGVILIVATVFACKESGETAVAAVDDIKADGPMEDKI